MTAPHTITDRDFLGDQGLEAVAARTALKKGKSVDRTALHQRETPKKRLVDREAFSFPVCKACRTPALAVNTQTAQRGRIDQGHAGRESESMEVRKTGQIFEGGGEREGAIRSEVESSRASAEEGPDTERGGGEKIGRTTNKDELTKETGSSDKTREADAGEEPGERLDIALTPANGDRAE